MFCGIIGEEARYEITVLGDAVNVAARLEHATKLHDVPILVSEAARLAAAAPAGKKIRRCRRSNRSIEKNLAAECFQQRTSISTDSEIRKTRPLRSGVPSATFAIMRSAFENQSPAFDPFGEPVADGVARACPVATAGDRTARRVGGAVFWTLALAILAGRVYAYDLPAVQAVASHAAQALALR